MRDGAPTMTESAPMPLPFKLEREVTLMPNEFRERLSAKQKSRKSSAARSGIIRSHSSKPTTGKFRYSKENSSHSSYYGQGSANQSPVTEAHYVKSVKISKVGTENIVSPQSSFHSDKINSLPKPEELTSTSSHIELSGEVKFMLDNAYANYESEGGFSVRTPPKNMQIKDLMIPLDDWNNKETIREKKYTVLPSIKNKKSRSSEETDSVTLSNRNSSSFSINNQLDFFRDKIEQEADFFADFRVNTSKVKPTPRQDPLPPIARGSSDNALSSSASSKKSSISPKKLSDKR